MVSSYHNFRKQASELEYGSVKSFQTGNDSCVWELKWRNRVTSRRGCTIGRPEKENLPHSFPKCQHGKSSPPQEEAVLEEDGEQGCCMVCLIANMEKFDLHQGVVLWRTGRECCTDGRNGEGADEARPCNASRSNAKSEDDGVDEVRPCNQSTNHQTDMGSSSVHLPHCSPMA